MKWLIRSQTSTLQVCEWIDNFISYFITDVIIYLSILWFKLINVIKVDPGKQTHKGNLVDYFSDSTQVWHKENDGQLIDYWTIFHQAFTSWLPIHFPERLSWGFWKMASGYGVLRLITVSQWLFTILFDWKRFASLRYTPFLRLDTFP